MELFKPFRGYYPHASLARDVIAPPYDTVSLQQAAEIATTKNNILHVTRSEIDCDSETHSFDEHVYWQAKQNWQTILNNAVFHGDQHECYYVYQITSKKHSQTGVVGLVSMQAYQQQRIRKHEQSQLQVEFDRARLVKEMNAQVSPAMLIYRHGDVITEIAEQVKQQTKPILDSIPLQGEHHSLWRVSNPQQIAKLTEAVRDLGFLYIADGHHRMSAMSRVALERPNEEGYQFGLAALFPATQLQSLPYHRLLRDLNGMTPNELLEKLNHSVKIETRARRVEPLQAHQFGLYLQNQWYRLTSPRSEIAAVTFLHEQIIKPLFNILDPRTDQRIHFVSEKQGISELEKQVDAAPQGCGFTLPAISVDDVLTAADHGTPLPIKSTWFSPKLADGLIHYSMDD